MEIINAAHISKIIWKTGKKRNYENRISEETVLKKEGKPQSAQKW